MYRRLLKLLSEAKHGLLDGIAGTFNDHYDQQEQERQQVLRHVMDSRWSDDEVRRELLLYCLHYDRTLRLSRTREVLDRLFEQRPELLKRLNNKHL